MKLKILSFLLSATLISTCAFGFSACKEPKSVSNMHINDKGELIVSYSDRTTDNLGKVTGGGGANGQDGKDGVSIVNAELDADGNLIIKLSDGQIINAGQINQPLKNSAGELYYTETKGENNIDAYIVSDFEKDKSNIVVIPETYNNKPVIGIAAEAFKDNTKITNVIIPDSVTSLGERAFSGCASLTQISFGRGLKSIGLGAFSKCEKLKSVKISDINKWSETIFADVSANPLYFASNLYLNNILVKNITLDSATVVENYAFYSLKSLESVNIGNSVASIGDEAFFGAENLKTVSLGASVTSIGELAFSNCAQLDSLTLNNALKDIGPYSFFRCGELTSLVIPSSVERIEESAFSYCSKLQDLTLNKGLKYIGDAAFAGCPQLKKFIMPNSVESIGMSILMNLEGGGFNDGSGTLTGLSEIKLSDKLTEIPDFSFSMCGFKQIIIPENIQKINYSSFYGCAELESVVIPLSVKHISSYAFYQCPKLKKIFYMGTAEEWARFATDGSYFIGSKGNEPLSSNVSTIYHYSLEKPTSEGNFWHYVDGMPTPWESVNNG